MKDYYLGLDMGTSSVGWAVTDDTYKILRAKGKDLWGVRLFETASTAEGRRTQRVAKRRRQREVARIGVVKDFFHDEIKKIDPNFYERLEDSKYHLEDKRFNSKFGIFADKNFTDKQYYEMYPTIFHLRMALINGNEKQDIRLIYLAVLNLFKHRGHFLNKSMDSDVDASATNIAYEAMVELLDSLLDIQLLQDVDIVGLSEVLKEKGISRTKRAEELAGFLQVAKKEKKKYEVIKGICGLDMILRNIFGDSIIDEDNKKMKLGFTQGNYEENAEKARVVIGDELFEVIEVMKQLHDIGVLLSVMQGNQYLSEARVKSYEKHGEDLKLLKEIIFEYAPEKFDDMFRNEREGNYSGYVKSTNSGKKIRRGMKNSTKEDLYKTIKGILKNTDLADRRVKYILTEIENEDFLPKQLMSSNGVIPNQVHLKELKAILKKAQKHYPFLEEKDETGLTIAEKIEELYTFQIPYYIGPLNTQHIGKGGNAWVVRKEVSKGPVLPWNFEEKIDTMASAEEFIKKMVRRCTYLNQEMCLPESSLLYEKFKVLNELNNVKVNEEKLSVELKQKIYEQLFMKGKRVTRKQLCNFLLGEGIIVTAELNQITGIDGDFKNSLSSYGKFAEVFGESIKLDATKEMVEHIIYWSTIYGEDKKFLKRRILADYKDSITADQLKRICGFKCKEWGNLSRSFLEMHGCDKLIGESFSIIQMMWMSNENLMQLLSNNYSYLENLEEQCKKVEKPLAEFNYDDLEESYLSMPVKRMVWQTIQIIQELETVLGAQPKKIFVEMARGEEEKKRTVSRKAKLLELYKGCKQDSRDWCGELINMEESKLRSKKLYLYYLQKGRCMYTGAEINLDDLMHSNDKYDIDHIYPRSYVKDDSLENNLVLVDKSANARKKDTYPVDIDIHNKLNGFWRSLEDGGFISQEKFKRLACRDSFTDEQMAGFINRQLVETRQGTKAITQMLKQTCSEGEIVYVQARNVSAFRMDSMFIQHRGKENEVDNRLIKCRSVNDIHHAHDAYLNIVVGNVYNTKFTKFPMNYIKQHRKQKEDHSQKNPYHMDKIFAFDVQRNGEWAWRITVEDGQIKSRDMVLKMLKKATPLITFMTLSGHGQIANATLYGARTAKVENYISLKTSDKRMADVTKYGGFTSVSTAFFSVIEHADKKGKRIRTIEAMPLYLFRDKSDAESIRKYCEDKLVLKEVRVCLNKIPMQALLRLNGYNVRITGKTDAQYAITNMVPLILNQRDVTYVKWIDDSLNGNMKGITVERNIELYDTLVKKHETTIFAKKKNSILPIIQSGREQFVQLEMELQCKILQQIIMNTVFKNMTIDLRLIGGNKESGKSRMSKIISNNQEVVLINQSVTGLFENTVDLLSV